LKKTGDYVTSRVIMRMIHDHLRPALESAEINAARYLGKCSLEGGFKNIVPFLTDWDHRMTEAGDSVTEVQLIGWFLEQTEQLPELAYDVNQRDRLPINDPGRSYAAFRARVDALVNKRREKEVDRALDPTQRVSAKVAKTGSAASGSVEVATIVNEGQQQQLPDPNSKTQHRKATMLAKHERQAATAATGTTTAAAAAAVKGKAKGKGSKSRNNSTESRKSLTAEEKAKLPCYRKRDHDKCEVTDCGFNHSKAVIDKAKADKLAQASKTASRPQTPINSPRVLPPCREFNSAAGCKRKKCMFPHVASVAAGVAKVRASTAAQSILKD
jgi:hypothetical protein